MKKALRTAEEFCYDVGVHRSDIYSSALPEWLTPVITTLLSACLDTGMGHAVAFALMQPLRLLK
jgi:hypothetical protein